MAKCGRHIDGYRISGECELDAGHEGQHAIAIDHFNWDEGDYCIVSGCQFLAFDEELCADHRKEKGIEDAHRGA